MAGALLAELCCAAPLLAVLLPLAGLGVRLTQAGLLVFPFIVACVGLVAWGVHHHRVKAGRCETKADKEGVRP